MTLLIYDYESYFLLLVLLSGFKLSWEGATGEFEFLGGGGGMMVKDVT